VVAIGDPTNFGNIPEFIAAHSRARYEKKSLVGGFCIVHLRQHRLLTAFPVRADIKDVAIEGPALNRTAWLFTRGDSSVTMSVNEDDSGMALVVLGPGAATATYRFTHKNALTAFAQAQEQKLLDEGFQLQAVAERRSGRGPRPGGPERRRSS
jgi:hypothetical protein